MEHIESHCELLNSTFKAVDEEKEGGRGTSGAWNTAMTLTEGSEKSTSRESTGAVTKPAKMHAKSTMQNSAQLSLLCVPPPRIATTLITSVLLGKVVEGSCSREVARDLAER